MRIRVFFFLFMSSLFCCCKDRADRISISSAPVYSETDTFTASTGHRIYGRYDYFIVKGNITNSGAMYRAINSFVRSHANLQSSRYEDYIMEFYKESDAINETAINAQPAQYRYKIFTSNKENDFLVGYTFKLSQLQAVDSPFNYKN